MVGVPWVPADEGGPAPVGVLPRPPIPLPVVTVETPASPEAAAKIEQVRRRDPWMRAAQQANAVAALSAERHRPNWGARRILADEIDRQFSRLAMLDDVERIGGKTMVTLLVSGGGRFGIKRMNDELIGYAMNSGWLVPRQQAVLADVLSSLPLEPHESLAVGRQTFKQTDVVTNIEDPERLDHLLGTALRVYDRMMAVTVKRALDRATNHWSRVLEEAPPDSAEKRAARKRLAALRVASLEVAQDGFTYPLAYGTAEITHADAHGVVEASMNATKSALVARTDGTRGGHFDVEGFVEHARRGVAIGEEIRALGNDLTVDGVTHRIFVRRKDGWVLNRPVLRAIRKNAIDENELSRDERRLASMTRQYVAHVNGFDFYKTFSAEDLDTYLPGAFERARRVRRRLLSGRPVDKRRIESLLASNPNGPGVAELGTASEAAYFNRVIERSERLFVYADIIDLGLDLMLRMEQSMLSVANADAGDEDLFEASLAAVDEVVKTRRQAVGAAADVYEVFRKRAEAETGVRIDERPAILLLGGDEITLALDPAMRPYLGKMSEMLRKRLTARVAIAEGATDDTTPQTRRRVFRQAMARADQAVDLLKTIEKQDRRVRFLIHQVPDKAVWADLIAEHRALGIGRLYARATPAGCLLFGPEGVTTQRALLAALDDIAERASRHS